MFPAGIFCIFDTHTAADLGKYAEGSLFLPPISFCLDHYSGSAWRRGSDLHSLQSHRSGEKMDVRLAESKTAVGEDNGIYRGNNRAVFVKEENQNIFFR